MFRGILVALDYVLAVLLLGGFSAIAHAEWVREKKSAPTRAAEAPAKAGEAKKSGDKKEPVEAPSPAPAPAPVPEGRGLLGLIKAMAYVISHDRNALFLFGGGVVLLLLGSLLGRPALRLEKPPLRP